MLGLGIDILLLVLLGVTMFFGLRLSRQFSEIRADQARLEVLVKQLNEASGRAENAVQAMKKTAIDTSEQLQGRIGKAQALSEELEIMIEAGDSLAERLQHIAEDSRKSVGAGAGKKPVSKPAAKSPPKKTTGSTGQSRAERELREALLENRDKP